MSMLTWSYNHLPDLINKKEQYSFLNERRYKQTNNTRNSDEMSFLKHTAPSQSSYKTQRL